MAIRSGLGASIGFAPETTYGTGVTPSRFLEFTTEGLTVQEPRIESQGIRAGSTVRRTGRWATNSKGGGGPVTFEVADKGFGLLLKHTLGDVSITTPGGATATRLHTHTLGDMDDLSLTVQKGVPGTGGTVHPFTFLGCVITEAEFSLSVDGLLMFTPTFDARQMVTNIALASPSYPSDDRLYGYTQAAIAISSAGVTPTDLSIRIAHGMKTDRYYLSAAGTKGRPLLNAQRDIGGTLTFEFDSMTEANYFLSAAPGSEVAVEALMTGRQIESGFNYQFGVEMPACRFDEGGGIPQVGGPDVVTLQLPWSALDDGSNEPIEITYQTTDTAS